MSNNLFPEGSAAERKARMADFLDSLEPPRDPFLEKLREEAAGLARRLILAAWDYLHGRMPEKDLEALIGSRSYLSGLPTDDERNHSVASLLPPKSKK